ncbi:MAG: HAMP domain-containing protein [Rhodospirillales bacterium]|nr:HAMP domain-containing protein [Rhodospirillales bacterium]
MGAAVVVLTYSALAVSFGYYVKTSVEDSATHQTLEGALLLRQQLESLLNLGIPISQILDFDEQCNALIGRNENFAFAYVTDNHDRVLFRSDAPEYRNFSFAVGEDVLFGQRPALWFRSLVGAHGFIETTLPVSHDENIVGNIHVGIDYGVVVDKLYQVFKYPLILFVILLALSGTAIFIIFENLIGRPLRTLSKSIESFGKKPGPETKKIMTYRKDEFGVIATAFNEMADSIECNIARRQAAEKDLVKLNETLEQRIKARTEQLLESKTLAEQASRAKTEFLSHMSHELRTPLNSIIGYAQAMQHQIKGELSESYCEYANNIATSGDLLLDTVNTILDLAKIEAGRFELNTERLSIEVLIQEALTVLEIQAIDKGLYLRNAAHLAPCLHIDELRVQQAFVNVVGNAIKFTDTGGITIEDEMDDDGYRIIVTDTGIGMDEAQVEKAFKPFAQAHGNSLSRQYAGTGLGLSFSQEIMRLHGGNLTMTSKPGEGTRVCLFFPRIAVEDASPKRALAT